MSNIGLNADGSEVTQVELLEYFAKFGEVASLTIARQNGELLRVLADREVLEEGCRRAEIIERTTGVANDKSSKIRLQMSKRDSDVERLMQKEYPIWKVFVIFNRQRDQVKCLKEHAIRGAGVHLFNGRVPKVIEAKEPSNIIYEYSDRSGYIAILWRFVSYFLAAGLMVGSYYCINKMLETDSGTNTAVFISLINTTLPMLMKYLTLYVEIHFDGETQEVSLLTKLIVVRCINSAVLIYVATPFGSTFTQQKIEAIWSTLVLTALMNPVLQIFDPSVYFNRYVLGYFAKTQSDLNDLYRSTEWTLAERYTDTIKSVFMSLFYAVVLPSGLFICAFTVLISYMTDRYCLFHIWHQPPQVNENIGIYARFFVILSLWVILSRAFDIISRQTYF